MNPQDDVIVEAGHAQFQVLIEVLHDFRGGFGRFLGQGIAFPERQAG